MQRSLCPHSGTIWMPCFAPSCSFTYFTNASPRARRVAPCAIAGHEESNPPSGSVSTWPSATRPLSVDDAEPENAKGAWETDKPHAKFSYGAFQGSGACPNYDRWPAGLQNRTAGYTVNTSDEQLKKQLVSRPTTFLFGQVDTLPLGGFDSSCPAMAQGATRRARGEAYVKYINEKLGAKHQVQIVSECGHNDRCVYTTDSVLPVIFPKQP